MAVLNGEKDDAKSLRRSLWWAIISTNLVGMPALAVFIFAILGVISKYLVVDFHNDPLFVPATFTLLLSISVSFVVIHYQHVMKTIAPAEEFLAASENSLEERRKLAGSALAASEKFPYRTMSWSFFYYWIGSPMAIALIHIPYCFSLRQSGALFLGVISTGMAISVFQFYTCRRVLTRFQAELLSEFPDLLLEEEGGKKSFLEVGIKMKFMGALVILASTMVMLTAVSAFNSARRSLQLQLGEVYLERFEQATSVLDKKLAAGAAPGELSAYLDGLALNEDDRIVLVDKDHHELLGKGIDPATQRLVEVLDHELGWTVEFRRPSVRSLGEGLYAAVVGLTEYTVCRLPLKNADLFILIPSSTYAGAIQGMYILVFAVIAFLIPLALFYGKLASEEITDPLHSLMESLKDVAGGDLSANVLVTSRDEMGVVSRSLARAIFNLRKLIGLIGEAVVDLEKSAEVINDQSGDVSSGASTQKRAVDETSLFMEEMQATVQSITDSIQTLASSTEESSASIIEVQATVEQVAGSVDSLSSAVEETTSSIHQMSTSIKQVAENVQHLNRQAEQAVSSLSEMDKMISRVSAGSRETEGITWQVANDADQGSKAVGETIAGMEKIEDDSREVSEVITRLGKRAQEIGNILTVIENVTEETNLLALNAAIIAAQAGEHGRGFSVVADEIKDLAERTASSTQEIAELIKSVQGDSGKAVERMRAGSASISDGVKLSQEAGRALQKIQESVSKAMEQTHSIAQAAMVQTEQAEQVMAFIQGLSSLITEVAQATQEQARNADLILNAAEKMEAISQLVRRATREQTQGSRQITQSIEHIAEITQYINSAQADQMRGTKKAQGAVVKIKDVADENQARVEAMTETVARLNKLADDLRAIFSEFKLTK